MKLTHLRILKLNFKDSDSLVDTDINTLAAILPKLPLLSQTELSFEGLRTIQEATLVRLFKTFQNMKNLSDLALNLEMCELASDGSISESLKCLVGSSIKRLSLDLFRNFSNQNLRELSEALKELASLESLSLKFDWESDIFDEPLAEFASALTNLTSLIGLNLTFPYGIKNKNHVQTIGCALISLQNLVSLKLAFWSSCQFQDSHLKVFFVNLKALRYLKYLDIKINYQFRITDASFELLGDSLKELSLPKSLSLDLRWTTFC